MSPRDTTQSASRHADEKRPFEVPDHELIRSIGTGSYGLVWLARSLTGTFRAVKIISRASFSNERPFEREFAGIQKFEPISRTHPGLVNILHVGRNSAGGYFYYVMELADDIGTGAAVNPESYCPRTLSGEIHRQGRLPIKECLEISVSLAAALGHLHQQGLVHRDIKPSNIIFVNGRPKFADIGLVTDISEKATCVGTEGYIPPEGPGSPSADLYSLGKVMYQISMGKGPDEFPELPTNLRELPEASALMRLNQIVLKTCDRTASKRFQSAEQMLAALTTLARQEFPGTGLTRIGQDGAPSTTGLAFTILNTADVQPDLRLAMLLQERLSAKGHEVWIDRHQALDLEWGREVEERIHRSDAIIIILSSASIRNEMLAYEIEIARQSRQSNAARPRLIPIRIQFSGKLPRQIGIALGATTCFSWDGPERDQHLVDEILNASHASATS